MKFEVGDEVILVRLESSGYEIGNRTLDKNGIMPFIDKELLGKKFKVSCVYPASKEKGYPDSVGILEQGIWGGCIHEDHFELASDAKEKFKPTKPLTLSYLKNLKKLLKES